ncbi:MAG: hypothetical protein AAB678_02640 [Patescibacteria group bacterium]
MNEHGYTPPEAETFKAGLPKKEPTGDQSSLKKRMLDRTSPTVLSPGEQPQELGSPELPKQAEDSLKGRFLKGK